MYVFSALPTYALPLLPLLVKITQVNHIVGRCVHHVVLCLPCRGGRSVTLGRRGRGTAAVRAGIVVLHVYLDGLRFGHGLRLCHCYVLDECREKLEVQHWYSIVNSRGGDGHPPLPRSVPSLCSSCRLTIRCPHCSPFDQRYSHNHRAPPTSIVTPATGAVPPESSDDDSALTGQLGLPWRRTSRRSRGDVM